MWLLGRLPALVPEVPWKEKKMKEVPERRIQGEFSKSRYFFKPQFRKELQIFTIHDAAEIRLAGDTVS